MISFFVPGDPKPQPRTRAFARAGKARVFTPGTAEAWKSEIAVAAKPFIDRVLDGPLSVRIVLSLPRPAAHFLPANRKRPERTLRPDAPIYHTARGDADNYGKAILDALTTLGAWHDDAQIAHLTVEKLWAHDRSGGRPGATIFIAPLPKEGL